MNDGYKREYARKYDITESEWDEMGDHEKDEYRNPVKFLADELQAICEFDNRGMVKRISDGEMKIKTQSGKTLLITMQEAAE